VTLLTPFKHIPTFNLSKLPIISGVLLRTQKPDLDRNTLTENSFDLDLDVRGEEIPSLDVLVQHPVTTPLGSESDPHSLPLSPKEVLVQIGSKLREWREYHHLSIDDMSARTQIQPRLIQAIEVGMTEMLPESVYVKGMIKRYADNLGLDGADIAQHMIPWEAAAAKTTTTVIPRQKTPGFSSVAQVKPFHVYLGYTLAICGIGAGTSHFLNENIKSQPIPITKVAVKPLKAVGVAPVAIPLPDVPIGISVKAPTWAQIGIDGSTKFTGTLNAGTQLNWTAKKQVTINTNNAGGLLFSRDLQPPQPLGKIGEKQNVTIKVMK
jgi:hypothetical protein